MAVPVLAIALTSAACVHNSAKCVRTHDRGCLVESVYREVADEMTGPYRERSSFRNQWGLEAIRADRAYAHLQLRYGPDTMPGHGVTVGMVDTGIAAAHPQLRDKNVIERFLSGASDEDGSEVSHGTAVASVLAGEDVPGSELDAQGVAPGADLVVFSIPVEDPPERYEPIASSELPGAADRIVEIVDAVGNWSFGSQHIDFVNLSVGFSGIIEDYGEEDLREHFAPALDALAQKGSEEKVVFVWAAGNSHGLDCEAPTARCVDGAVDASSVEILAGLAARVPELRGHTVGVVAIGPEDGLIAGFSNRCGIAADHCLAAPGDQVQVAYLGPDREGNPGSVGIGVGAGSSFAAPMVTGGLALMKQYFRSQLSNPDLLARLLETADRSGPYADAATYGRGLLGLGAATAPVGEPEVAAGDRVAGSGAGLNDTRLELGLAFGDAFALSLEEREIAAFDRLGAPFWYPLGSFARASSGPALSERLRDFARRPGAGRETQADTRFPLLSFASGTKDAMPALHFVKFGASAAGRAGHFALARQGLFASLPVATGLTAAALTTEGLDGRIPVTGAELALHAPGSRYGLRAGWMSERQSLLGSVPDGAFGDLEAHARFAGVNAKTDLGAWRVGGTAELGTVDAWTRGGLFEEISTLATSAFALHASRPTPNGGLLRVSLSQPLRVEAGHARLAVPSGRTPQGEVVRTGETIDLEPSGRQIDLDLQWHRPLEVGTLRLGVTSSREPGHRKDAESDLVLLCAWRAGF